MQPVTNRLTIELRRLSNESHDHCVSCSHLFVEGETSHLGYGYDDNPMYVCDRCSSKLKETAVRNYFIPLPYNLPGQSSKLWRYMDFTKYVSMLSTRGLYFTRTDTFEDLFEGAKGFKKYKQNWDTHYFQHFRSVIKNPPPGYTCELSEVEVDTQVCLLL